MNIIFATFGSAIAMSNFFRGSNAPIIIFVIWGQRKGIHKKSEVRERKIDNAKRK